MNEVADAFDRHPQVVHNAGANGSRFRCDATIVDSFESVAAQLPKATALVFEGARVDYRTLERRGNQLAWELIARGVGPEDIVALYLPRGIDMIVGILGVLKAGGAYLPLDAALPEERTTLMSTDAATKATVTISALAAPFGGRVLCLDTLAADLRLRPHHAPTNADRLRPLHCGHPAYVIYTSGSTGQPKGVVVTHRQVVRLFLAAQTVCACGPDDVWTLFHSYAFDFSVWEIWGALLHGASVVIVPQTVTRSPDALWALLSDERVTHFNTTPSVFYRLMEVDTAQPEPRKLALKMIVFGGEALQVARLAPWWKRHSDDAPRLINMYGITETTVHATQTPLSSKLLGPDELGVIGSALPDLDTYVLDDRLQPCPEGVIGELYISGEGLARGYLRKPGLTASRFIAHPFGAAGERLYRTGDLASWAKGGVLTFHGRADDQVKIRGHRIEPGEIEAALVVLPQIAQAAVALRTDLHGEPHLVAYVIASDGRVDAAALRRQLAGKLPDYMIPAVFVELPALPLTINGKVDRSALPEPDSNETRDYSAPRTPEETLLCSEAAAILGIGRVGLGDNFFDLGGHSLSATRLVGVLAARFGRALPLQAVFDHPVMRDLAQLLRESPLAGPRLTKRTSTDAVPASFAQARLWLTEQIDGPSARYTIPCALRLEGELDTEALSLALGDVVARHEALRTRLRAGPDGSLEQEVLAAQAACPVLVVEPVSEAGLAERMAWHASRPFRLAEEIPLRAVLFCLGEDGQKHVLLLLLHHSAGDGWSLAPLLEDLGAAYEARQAGRAPVFAPLPVQYADYTLWQRALLGEVEDPASLIARQLAWWRDQLEGLPEEIALPADHERPREAAPVGGRVRFTLPGGLHGRLQALAQQEGASLFMVLQAGLTALLHRMGAGEDIPVGIPVAGRGDPALDGLAGFFVNTLVLRTRVQGDAGFDDLVRRVRQVALDAYAHQDLPFERLVEALAPPRQPGRQPLFQTMLVLHNEAPACPAFEGLRVTAVEPPVLPARFDLSVAFTPEGEELAGVLDYNSTRFGAMGAERLCQRLVRLLGAACAAPSTPLSQLPVLLEEDEAVCRAPLPVAEVETLTGLLEGCGGCEVRLGGRRIGYEALHGRANALARELIARGIGPEDVVALALPRSVELVLGVLGALKAGAAFLPLDPGHPRVRLEAIIEEARPALVIADAAGSAALAGLAATPVCLVETLLPEGADEYPPAPADDERVRALRPEHPAYLLYTSGSTGRPKGVVISQTSIARYIRLMRDEVAGVSSAATHVGLFTPLVFDLSLTSLLLPLVSGGCLELLPEGPVEASLAAIFSASSRVRLVKLTPAHLALLDTLPADANPQLEFVIVGGEALLASHVAVVKRRAPRARVLNEYGPTETTIGAVAGFASEADQAIGEAYPGMRALVLDKGLRPCPTGVEGELYLLGTGLGRGYQACPGLTASRFVASPYGSPGSRLYRTGDLAVRRSDGQLVYRGRSDDQVKIRGYRIEPGEVEAALTAHAGVAQAVVLARPGPGGDPQLQAWLLGQEGCPCPDDGQLRRHLAGYLTGAMVPSRFIWVESFPLTANGKLDRAHLPDPEPSAPAPAARPPASEAERLVCRLVGGLLGLEAVSPEADFFAIGGHSLAAARLIAALRQATGRSLPMKTLFAAPALHSIATALQTLPQDTSSGALTADPAKAHEPFPLTPVQQAYWLGRQRLVALGELACHAYSELSLCDLDPERFTRVWREAVAAHPALRTVITPDGMQRVLKTVPELVIPVEDCRGLAPEVAEAQALATREALSHQVLDAATWPLFDVRLTRLGEAEWRLHLGIDALILDGESTALLLEEVFARYEGRAPASANTPLSFRDYVLYMESGQAAREAARAWWMTRLDSLPPAPALPLATDPSKLASPRFVRWHRRLAPEAWSALKARAAAEGLTPSAVLLTAYGETIAGWTRQEAFTLNLTVGDRQLLHPDVASLLGVFTTLTPLAFRAARTDSLLARARAQQDALAAQLDHRAFSGVEVQRALARRAGDPEAGLLPVVFTSLLGEAGFAPARHGARQVHAITQTPQTWLDNKVYEDEEGGLCIDWDAPGGLFPDGLGEAMTSAYHGLLARLAAEPAAWTETDRRLVPAEQLALMAEINATAGPCPQDLLGDPVFAAMTRSPAAPALIWDGEVVDHGKLDELVAHHARELTARLAESDQPVAIVMEKGPEQIIAALAILKTGRAFLPVSAGQPDARIAAILRQAGVRLVLTQPHLSQGRPWQEEVELLNIAAEEKLPVPAPGPVPARRAKPDDLAYVIYTSGSTGTPKGVAISHRAARNTLADMIERFSLDARDRVLWVSSFEFDLSIFDVFAVLGVGGAVVIPPPDARETPGVLSQAVEAHGVTVWNSVPAIAELMLAAALAPARQLASLRLILLSGDWIPLTLPPALRAATPSARLISLGGATEAAIWSIFHPIEEIDPSWISIPYGRPLRNQAFQVLKDDLSVCPLYVPGRLYIEGTGLALGYWNDPSQTAERFVIHPRTGTRLYDTGDLGYRDADGIIRFLGREDTQVKIRGFRIELGEIEKTLEQHPAVKAAAAIPIKTNTQHKIIAAIVRNNGAILDTQALHSWSERYLPSYMHPADYFELDALPLTSNGKIDRVQLTALAMDTSQQTRTHLPETPHEIVVCALVGRLLGAADVSPDTNFFHLGGDSITAVRLVNDLKRLGWTISPSDIFATPVLGNLAALQAARAEAAAQPDVPSQARGNADGRVGVTGNRWPLTPLQEGLWFLAHCEPEGNDPYNVQILVELEGRLDVDRLKAAIQAVVDRHEGLRVRFDVDETGRGIQIVSNGATVPFERIDLSRFDPTKQAETAALIQAEDRALRFDLASAPLIRAKCLGFGPDKHRLILSQHHLLADGWSSSIFFQDLYNLYKAGSVSARPEDGSAPSLRAFVDWRANLDMAASVAFWRSAFEGFEGPSLVAPNLARDRIPRVSHAELTLQPELTAQISSLARAEGVTEASVMEAIWAFVVSTLTGLEDACFGSVASGREAPVAGIESIVGLLITTLPVRIEITGDRSMRSIMRELHAARGRRLAHQYLSLSAIQKAVGKDTLFDTLFTYENYPLQAAPDLTDADALPVANIRGFNGNHYPASLAVIPGERMLLRLHYSEGRFDRAEAELWLERLRQLVSQVVEDPSRRVRELDPLLPHERVNIAPASRSAFVSLPEMIRFAAAGDPDAPAVSAYDRTFSYAALIARSATIATELVSREVRPETHIALLMPRSADAIAAMLGVWAAGAAFVPLDPQSPGERLLHLLSESSARIILTTSEIAASEVAASLSQSGLSLICLDELETRRAPDSRETSIYSTWNAPARDKLAYVIFTSGSTGRPKGVEVTHEGLPVLAREQAARMGIKRSSRVLQVASLTFDAAQSEIAMTLASGAHLVVAGEHERAGPPLARLLEQAAITHMTLTPTALAATTPPGRAHRLERLISAGEAPSLAALGQWAGVCKIINAYGPTEATVCATMSSPWQGARPLPPAGRPIGLTDVLVLDRYLRSCPAGVVGEIYLTGAGLARGYATQPGLTASRFVASPFGPAGSRMYRTGDVGFKDAEGVLHFQGRNDSQVKIRGHRVEPLEIEAILRRDTAIRDALVTPVMTPKQDPALVAYLIPFMDHPDVAALEAEHLALWTRIESGFERHERDIEDPTFDTSGWNSSYTGRPLPRSEVAEYAEETAARIRGLSPRRILDVGCGTGLIGFQLMRDPVAYIGVDLSEENILRLRRLHEQRFLAERFPGLADALFIRGSADQLPLKDEARFDTIVLTSVIQYFPTRQYLDRVLETLTTRFLTDRGFVFVGDVRNLALQPTLEASRAAFAVRQKAAIPEQAHENELLLDPAYFYRLASAVGRNVSVSVMPKRARHMNEMARFRYDVVLSRAGRPLVSDENFAWRPAPASLRVVEEALSAIDDAAAWRGMPNARAVDHGLDPDDLRDLGEALDLVVDIALRPFSPDGAFDVVFRRGVDDLPEIRWDSLERESLAADEAVSTIPIRSALEKHLGERARRACERQLPSYMMPSSFVVIDHLPMTRHGKVDFSRLQAPGEFKAASTHVPPRTETERSVCTIVEQVLGVSGVGIADNFLHLGGDSISSIRLINLAREAGIKLTAKDVFLAPVLGDLAQLSLDRDRAPIMEGDPVGAFPSTPIMHWLAEIGGHGLHFSQALCVPLPGDATLSHVADALQALLDAHPMLTAIWARPDEVETRRPGAADAASLLTRCPAGAADKDVLIRQLSAELDATAGDLLRACWLEAKDGPGHLLLVAHHIAVDAVSWQILVPELKARLVASIRGEVPPEPARTTSFRHWARTLSGMAGSFGGEASLWRVHGAGVVRSCFPGISDAVSRLSVSVANHRTTLTGTLADRLLNAAPTRLGVHADELLLATLSLALLSTCQSGRGSEGSIRLAVEGHGRPAGLEGIDLTRTVGWFTAVHPLRLTTGGTEVDAILNDPRQLLRQLRRTVWEMRRIPEKGLGYGFLRYLDDTLADEFSTHPVPEVAFNYLGRFGGDDLPPEQSGSAISGWADDRLPLPHPLAVNVVSHGSGPDTQLEIDWRFDPSRVSIDDVARIADAFEVVASRLVAIAEPGEAALRFPHCTEHLHLTADELEAIEAVHGDVEEIWPLTSLQEGIAAFAGEQDPYQVQLVTEVDEIGGAGPVREALDWVVDRHPSLRAAVVRSPEGRAVQVIKSSRRAGWSSIDLSRPPPDEEQRELRRIIAEDRSAPFDLESAPLVRATHVRTATGNVLVLSMHHLTADGWSGEIILRELDYALRNPDRSEVAPPVSFRHVVDWTLGKDTVGSLERWRRHLEGFEAPAQREARGDTRSFSQRITPEVGKRLEALARAHSVTLATVLAGAWSILLGYDRQQDEICFGMVSSGRQLPVAGIEDIVGMLVQTVPMRVPVPPAASVFDAIKALQAEIGIMSPDFHVPLHAIQREHGRGQLFDTLFTFENYPGGAGSGSALRVIGGHSGTHYPLSLIVIPGESLELRFQYTDGTFSEADIAGMAARLVRLLETIARYSSIRLCDVDLLSERERRCLIDEANRTAQAYENLTLPQMFQRVASRIPDAVAVIGEDETLTFERLSRCSRHIAARLQQRGVVPGDIVALCLPRGARMVAAILGVLQAGGTYLPLDVRHPEARRRFILEDARPKLVLTVPEDEEWFADGPPVLIVGEQLDANPEGFVPSAFASDLGTHVIYTSGSTGKPKGVTATHRNVVRLIAAELGDPVLSQPGVWSMLHSYAFDFSVYEIWGSLISGSSLVIVPEEGMRSSTRLLDCLIKHGVTVLNITPGAYANLMLEAVNSGRLAELDIRLALVGGEAWSPSRIPGHPPRVRVRNVYGPTECTIFTTMSEPLDLLGREPPLGGFLPNLRGYVLDNVLRPCPEGVEGELYVSGDGLARGYLNRPGLTASIFVGNPFGSPGTRLYRTGDRVMWRHGGGLVFRGRADGQVKLRGLRVELGEIEAAMSAMPELGQVSVQLEETPGAQKKLVAYVVSAAGIKVDDGLVQALRDRLRHVLPAYMIPARFVWLDLLPMNANGKLDRAALGRRRNLGAARSFTPPESPLEIAVCHQAAAVLNIDRIGLDDPLPELGLDSLSAARLAAVLRPIVRREVGLVQILGAQTASGLIRNLCGAAPADQSLSEVVILREDGTGQPLFCLYPGTGLSWAYANLLPLVGRNRPLILIQAPNIDSDPEGWEPSFEDVVERCLTLIRGHRAIGPYSLAGWSFGGMVAHCLATRLQAQGERVASLTLFDSFPMPEEARPDYPDQDKVWRDIALGANLDAEGVAGPLTAETIRETAVRQNHLLGRLPLRTLEALAANQRHNSAILPDARPCRFDGGMLFYRAGRDTRGVDRSTVSPAAWRPLVSGALTVIDIDAEHQCMLTAEAVAQMRGTFE
jgi:amino acid adenylation domain-containing protein/non-ribosomal peptide synthase protein (TIGR01720 family)